MNDWNQNYRETRNVFGADPAPSLERHHELIDNNLPVLDVGCGQGRNSLFLARRGHRVHALDPSTVAIEQTRAASTTESLPITTQTGTLESVHRPDHGFGTILVFGLIPILTRGGIDAMVTSVEALIAPGGLLFITAFTTEDPKYRGSRGSGRTNEYRHGTRTYLEPGELRSHFPEWSIVDYWEGLGPEHRHGDGPVERHGLADAVLRQS